MSISGRRRRTERTALGALLPIVLLLTLGGVTVVHPPLAPTAPETMTYPRQTHPLIAVTSSAELDTAEQPTESRLRGFAYEPGKESTTSEMMLPGDGDPETGGPGTADLDYSPDGRRAVFSEQTDSDGDPETSDVWRLATADVRGSQEHPSASPLSDPTPLDVSPLATDSDVDAQWSPDGHHIAFVRNRVVDTDDGSIVLPRIWIYDLDQPDAEPVPVTLPTSPEATLEAWSVAPSWSPDGSAIVFRGQVDGIGGAFAPPHPGELPGVSGLWHYDVTTGRARQIVLDEGVCFTVEGYDDYCSPDLSEVETLAWSPLDPRVLAIVDGDETVYRLTLPEGTAPTDDVVTVTENVVGWSQAHTFDDDFESPAIREIAWLPTGSLLLSTQSFNGTSEISDPFVFEISELPPPTPDEAMPATTLLTSQFAYAARMAVQPWSDLALDVTRSSVSTVGEPVTATVTVTNNGPSAPQPGWLLLGVPEGATTGAPPAGCIGVSAALVRCDVPALEPGEDLTVEFTFTPHAPGDFYWDVAVFSPTPDPTMSSSEGPNFVSDYFRLTDEPGFDPTPRQKRISFTMHRVAEVGDTNGWTLDLVQSLADPSSTGEDYRVLASDTMEGTDGPRLRDEDDIDYSPDGSRVVYTHEILPSEGEPINRRNHRIVVADVTGSQQPDPGTWTTPTELVPPEEGVVDDLFTDTDPAWSPDGSTISFVRSFYRNADSPRRISSSTLMLLDPANPDAATELLATDWLDTTSDLALASPTWSPDGSGVVFAVENGSVEGMDQPLGLWYVPVTGTPEQPVPLEFAPGTTDCAGLAAPCTGVVPARAPAFAPSDAGGARLAVTATAPEFAGADATFVLDLAAGAGGAPVVDTLARLSAEQDPDRGAWVGFTEPAWSPDGSAVTAALQPWAGEGEDEDAGRPGLITFHLAEGVSTVDFEPLSPDYWIDNPAYEPVSDLAIDLEATPEVTIGLPTTLTWTVTNTGPSPARDAIATIELPAGAGLDWEPPGCTLEGTTLACTVPGPIAPGDTASGGVELHLGTAGANDVTATATTNSIDPIPDNDEAAITIDAAYPATERISFSLRGEQPSEGYTGPPTYDLVQAIPEPAGEADPDSHLVLADTVYPELLLPDGTGNGIEHPADEDNLDYSPDGARVVYDRLAQRQVDIGSDVGSIRQLVVADVYGRQQGDLGEPGTLDLANLTPLTDPVAEVGDDSESFYSDAEPVWSPDGTQIAFVRSPYYSPRQGELALLDVATRTVTYPLAELDDFIGVSSPSWSPDGDGIVFSAPGVFSDSDALWYVSLEQRLPRPLVLAPADCPAGSDGCGVEGDEPAWSPDGGRLAFTDLVSDYDGLFVLDLPDIDPDATTDIVVPAPVAIDLTDPAADPEAFSDLDVESPTWSPDGARVAVVRSIGRAGPDQIVQIEPGLADGVATAMYTAEYDPDNPYDAMVAHPDYVPVSDLAIGLEAAPEATAELPTTVTWTVTNTGPSPARDAIVTIELPAGTVVDYVPSPCTAESTTLTCTVDETIAVGESVSGELDVRLTTVGANDVTATLVTNSIDPVAGNDRAAITIDAAAPTYPATERISFSLGGDEPSEGYSGPTSYDLAQSIPEPAGDAGPDSHLVLAQTIYPELLFPDGTGSGVEYAADEDNLDYSPDGGLVVYDRVAQHQYSLGPQEHTDARQIVVADVYGEQQGDLGTPGTLDPGSITALTDPAGGDTVDPEALVNDTEPVWSPDETRVAFVRTPYGDYDGTLAVLDVADGDITFPLAGIDGVYGVSSPTWSPDGTGIVFAATVGDTWRIELFYVSLEDPTLRRIMLGPADCPPGLDIPCGIAGDEPTWSPDGDRLAFTDVGEDYSSLLLLDLPAIDPEQTTDIVVPPPVTVDVGDPAVDRPVDVTAPTWSPDGSHVAVALWNGPDLAEQIVQIDVTTAGATATSMYTAAYTASLDHPDYVPVSDLGIALDHDTTADGQTVVTVDVRNEGPSPARDAILTFEAPAAVTLGTLPAQCTPAGASMGGTQGVTCTFDGQFDPGEGPSLTVPVTFPAGAADHVFTGSVATNSIDLEAGNDRASTTVTTSAPVIPDRPPVTPGEPPAADLRIRLTLEEDRAWLGGDGIEASLVVRNEGPATAEDIRLTFTLPDGVDVLDSGTCPLHGVCPIDALGPNRQTTVTLTLLPTEVGDMEVGATVAASTADPRPQNNRATATFEGVQATLRLLPAVVRPGDVTLLYGVDLPPDAVITARWSAGVTASEVPISVREDGRLRFSMLIIEGDELGEREVEVTHVSGTRFGLETPPELLVVPRGLEPPEFVTRG